MKFKYITILDEMAGSILAPDDALLVSLKSELAPNEFNQACQQLLNILNKNLDKWIKKLHFESDLRSPFCDHAGFKKAIHQLRSNLISLDNCETRIAITYHSVCFLKYRSCDDYSEVIKYISNLVQYEDKNKLPLLTDNINNIFSACIGINIYQGFFDFKNSFQQYIDSPLQKFDIAIFKWNNIYKNRAWYGGEENIKVHHKIFVDALLGLRNMYVDHFNDHSDDPQIDFLVTEVTTVLNALLSFSSFGRKNNFQKIINSFNNECEEKLGDNSKVACFIKAVSAVLFIGLAYVSILGAIYGRRNNYDLVYFAKQNCGLNPTYSLNRYLTFQPGGALTEAKKISQLMETEAQYASEGWQIYKSF